MTKPLIVAMIVYFLVIIALVIVILTLPLNTHVEPRVELNEDYSKEDIGFAMSYHGISSATVAEGRWVFYRGGQRCWLFNADVVEILQRRKSVRNIELIEIYSSKVLFSENHHLYDMFIEEGLINVEELNIEGHGIIILKKQGLLDFAHAHENLAIEDIILLEKLIDRAEEEGQIYLRIN